VSCEELSVVGSEPTTPRVAGLWAISPMMMIVGTAWLVVYKDAADGMCPTVRDKVNEELLPFFKFLTVNARYDRDLVETPLPMTGLRRPVSYGTCEQGAAERIFMENLSPKDVFFSQIVC
jgi:hypothetical protein